HPHRVAFGHPNGWTRDMAVVGEGVDDPARSDLPAESTDGELELPDLARRLSFPRQRNRSGGLAADQIGDPTQRTGRQGGERRLSSATRRETDQADTSAGETGHQDPPREPISSRLG